MSFPLVTLAGLSDGINPCAIGMMIMLLGYLVVFHRKEKTIAGDWFGLYPNGFLNLFNYRIGIL